MDPSELFDQSNVVDASMQELNIGRTQSPVL